jgi:VWFA-related protein
MKFPAISLFIIGALLLNGQSSSNSAPLVNLNVTAVDSRGQPVADLRPEDFQIQDNGKPRGIVWFRALPGKRSQTDRTATAAPATFILLDLFNADFAARGLSANEVTRAVEKLESGDNVYLYLLTSSAKIFAVHSVVPSAQTAIEDGPWTRRVKPMLDQALRDVNALKSQDDRYEYLRIGPTWQALNELVSQMAEVPGPKSFLWITQGIENGYYDQGRQFQLDTLPLRKFAANLNAIEAAAYAVQQRPSGSLPPQNEGSPGDTLEQLSALTGGHVYPSDNTEQAVRQATGNAPRPNYRMAFLPDRLDGKYHKIRVTAMRKDIKIQTAERYYATAAVDVDQRDEAIEDAIGQSSFDYRAIGVAATMTKVEGQPGQFRFSIKLDAPDVELVKEGARYKGSVAIALVELRSDGRRAMILGKPADFDMSQEEYAKALTDGIEITREAKLDATTMQVRVIALDRSSSLAGTATIAVQGTQ